MRCVPNRAWRAYHQSLLVGKPPRAKKGQLGWCGGVGKGKQVGREPPAAELRR